MLPTIIHSILAHQLSSHPGPPLLIFNLQAATAAGTAERSHPASEARGGSRKEQPHARGQGGDWEEQPHTQRVVAVRVQEGLESHPTLKVRKGDGRRYPSSKVRSSGCALLEQP